MTGESDSVRVSERTSKWDGFSGLQRYSGVWGVSEMFRDLHGMFSGFERLFECTRRAPLSVSFYSQNCVSCYQ